MIAVETILSRFAIGDQAACGGSTASPSGIWRSWWEFGSKGSGRESLAQRVKARVGSGR